MKEISLKFKSWKKDKLPKKILTIRLQAMGDMVCTLPYLQYLKENMPGDTKLDFLVREEVEDIPKNLILFDKVYALKGGRNTKFQLFYLIKLLPKLWLNKYDVVLDLQNNAVSRICRKFLAPSSWTEFDKFSSHHACERYRNTINNCGFMSVMPRYIYAVNLKEQARKLLIDKGWNGSDSLIVLNPAGAFSTRNWEIENYIETAQQLFLKLDKKVVFLFLGLEKIKDKVSKIIKVTNLPSIDLVSETSPAEAFSLIQHIDLMISEDSGLMHMAYLSGKPTVGLLGSTRADWTDPNLEHTFFFTSSDMACGNCMLETCKFNTVECLTRIKPESVVKKSLMLLEHLTS